MALIGRLARLFRADFHAVLDRVEEPDILLRQALREMEGELARDEQSGRRLEREREQLGARKGELERLQRGLDEQLDVCFSAAQEDLARPLIRRRLEVERTLELLSRRDANLCTRLDRLGRRLQENHAQYDSLRQKAELFDQEPGDGSETDHWPDLEVRVHDEDVEVALLRERQRRAAS